MDRKVRIGIIGVGQIGKSHLEAYSKIDGVEVVAACDIDTPELQRVCGRYGIPDQYYWFREMIKRDDIDAIDVCLHNNLHAPATIACLEAGKHVYCEKPIAGTYIDGKHMLEAAAKNDRMLHIQLALLYEKETKATQELISEGRLGKLYHARSTGFRRRGRPWVDGYGSANFVKKDVAGGGALYDMGVYHISQLLYLLGLPEVQRISGKTYQEMDMDAGRRDSAGYGVEELGLGLVHFAGGLTLDIIESWAAYLDGFEGSSILGSEGGVRLHPFSYHTTVADLDMNASFDLGYMDFRWHQLRDDYSAYDSSQHHWVAALHGRVPLLPTAKVALQTMLVQEGIYLSNRLGREVTAADVEAMSASTAVVL